MASQFDGRIPALPAPQARSNHVTVRVQLEVTHPSNAGEKTTDGNVELLASKMNDFFISVSEHLLRLDRNTEAFDSDSDSDIYFATT